MRLHLPRRSRRSPGRALTAQRLCARSYAPWCSHCKQLAPEYEEVAKQLAAHDPPIPVAAVDATVEVELNARYGVPGFPTVFAFRGTTPVHYNDSHKNTQARAPPVPPSRPRQRRPSPR